MKCFTEAELMEKLVEAYSRGVNDAEQLGPIERPRGERIEQRLADIIHEDAGGHDGLGKKHG